MQNIELIKQIIDIVSKDIPEVKELKFGSLVIDLKHEFFGVSDPTIMTLISDSPEYYEDDGIDFLHYRGNPTIHIDYNNIKNNELYEIIGKIGYNDLLRYLSRYIYIGEMGDYLFRYYDLSKPLMEQSQEVLQQLLDYLKALK